MNIKKALDLLNDNKFDELRLLLDTELYLTQSVNKTTEKGKIAILNRILKRASKQPNTSIHGTIPLPDEGNKHGYMGITDSYVGIRTARRYPLPHIDVNAPVFNLHKAITDHTAGYLFRVDIKKLKKQKALKEKYVTVAGSVFDTVFLLDMLTFFNTDILYLASADKPSSAYLKTIWTRTVLSCMLNLEVTTGLPMLLLKY